MLRYLFLFILPMLSVGNTYSFCVPDATSGDQEYEVYSALLNQEYVDQRTAFLIVINQTVAASLIAKELERDDLRQMLSPVSPSTVDAFRGNNKEPETLKEAFKLKVKYTLLGNNEWGEYFKGDVIKGWEEFYRKNPGASGYIRLSRVGFNPERDEALVYVEHGCGATCGTGNYALLTKSEKGWRVKRMVQLWIA